MTTTLALKNTDSALDVIIRDIAEHATNVVAGAWNIGRLLNEAADIIGDDAEFGKWRAEKLERDIGIDKRTAQRMQAIHRAFPSIERVAHINLTALYTLAAPTLPEARREAIIELAAARVENGERLTAREATTFASESRTTIKQRDGRSLLDTARREVGLDPVDAPTFDDKDEEAKDDTPEQAAARARRACRQENAQVTQAEQWAKNVADSLKRRQGRSQAERLNALLVELKKAGLADGSLTINVRTNAIECANQ